jgi:hypothetical protein
VLETKENLMIRKDVNPTISFEDFVNTLLRLLSFEVTAEPAISHFPDRYRPDFMITKDKLIAISEVKFYRSRIVDPSLIIKAAKILAFYSNVSGFPGVLIVSSIVPKSLKETIAHWGIVVWDRSNITNFLLAVKRDALLYDLGLFFMEVQQGIDTSNPYDDVDEDTDRDPLQYFPAHHQKIDAPLEQPGQKLINKLQTIAAGKEGWSQFEVVCTEVLKYLFEADLSLWERQSRTDDALSRFDLICRINPSDDFWRTLIQSFNSRYVLFEFKNYTKELPAGQIYTTERYLYPKALRGTSIIIARNGVSTNAVSATKGALRENGKLILCITQADLEHMLDNKDNGDSPSDYLSDKLDSHLINLSR